MVRFGDMGARDWQDQITFRSGLYQDKYVLRHTGEMLIENGLSMGIGFKFAATGNQIDFSFRYGSRSIRSSQKELFQEFTIGVSLGDIWFLRRRAKQ